MEGTLRLQPLLSRTTEVEELSSGVECWVQAVSRSLSMPTIESSSVAESTGTTGTHTMTLVSVQEVGRRPSPDTLSNLREEESQMWAEYA